VSGTEPPTRPAFRHDESGRSADEWDEVHAARRPTLSLDGVDQVVVVSAHPDDETLGAGGLIAAARAAGIAVTVVVLTAGEQSHPMSPTHPASLLARVRRTELVDAVSRLGDGVTLALEGYPDGDLSRLIDDVADSVERAIRVGVGRTLLVVPWRADGHPDHEAAGTAAAAVAATSPHTDLLEYPVWFWHWADPTAIGAVPLVELPLADDIAARKAAAIAAFASQTEPLSGDPRDAPVLLPGFLAHFRRPCELFVAAGLASHRGEQPMDADYFDQMYARSPDPWGFADRFYERRKRALTLAALPRERFRSAFEPGCSIGLITQQLAERCDAVLATDIAPAALATASERVAAHPHVRLEKWSIGDEWPAARFDLVVLSEVGYYLPREDLPVLAARAAESLADDGCLVACHWRHPVAEYPTTGDAVHAALRRARGLDVLAEHVEEDFRLDVLVRSPAISVAAREGLT
jgi:LmbE family N-acetylglucosaminyl deacetylase